MNCEREGCSEKAIVRTLRSGKLTYRLCEKHFNEFSEQWV